MESRFFRRLVPLPNPATGPQSKGGAGTGRAARRLAIEGLETRAMLAACAISGDADHDNDVDGDDLGAWEAGFGIRSSAKQSDGDVDRDNAVTGSDFLAWQAGFGTASVAAACPAVELVLANDVGPRQTVNDDRITTDPSIRGTLASSETITSLVAGFGDGPPDRYVDILFALEDGTFLLDEHLLTQIASDAIHDGLHTLSVVASDASRRVSEPIELEFTLAREGPASLRWHVVPESVVGQPARGIALPDAPDSADVVLGLDHGELTVDSEGLATYTPEEGFVGVERIVYRTASPTDPEAILLEEIVLLVGADESDQDPVRKRDGSFSRQIPGGQEGVFVQENLNRSGLTRVAVDGPQQHITIDSRTALGDRTYETVDAAGTRTLETWSEDVLTSRQQWTSDGSSYRTYLDSQGRTWQEAWQEDRLRWSRLVGEVAVEAAPAFPPSFLTDHWMAIDSTPRLVSLAHREGVPSFLAGEEQAPTVTAEAFVETPAYRLKKSLGLSGPGSELFNLFGLSEKWIAAAGGAWYVLLPNGQLLRARDTFAATFSPDNAAIRLERSFYDDASELWAAEPIPAPVDVEVAWTVGGFEQVNTPVGPMILPRYYPLLVVELNGQATGQFTVQVDFEDAGGRPTSYSFGVEVGGLDDYQQRVALLRDYLADVPGIVAEGHPAALAGLKAELDSLAEQNSSSTLRVEIRRTSELVEEAIAQVASQTAAAEAWATDEAERLDELALFAQEYEQLAQRIDALLLSHWSSGRNSFLRNAGGPTDDAYETTQIERRLYSMSYEEAAAPFETQTTDSSLSVQLLTEREWECGGTDPGGRVYCEPPFHDPLAKAIDWKIKPLLNALIYDQDGQVRDNDISRAALQTRDTLYAGLADLLEQREISGDRLNAELTRLNEQYGAAIAAKEQEAAAEQEEVEAWAMQVKAPYEASRQQIEDEIRAEKEAAQQRSEARVAKKLAAIEQAPQQAEDQIADAEVARQSIIDGTVSFGLYNPLEGVFQEAEKILKDVGGAFEDNLVDPLAQRIDAAWRWFISEKANILATRDKVIHDATRFIAEAPAKLQGALSAIEAKFVPIVAPLDQAIEQIDAAAQEKAAAISGTTTTAVAKLQTKLNQAREAAHDVYQSTVEEAAVKLVDQAVDLAYDAVEVAAEVGAQIEQALTSMEANNPYGTISSIQFEAGQQAVGAIASLEDVTDAINAGLGSVGDLVGDVVDYGSDRWHAFSDWGADRWEAMSDYASDRFEAAEDYLEPRIGAVVDALKDAGAYFGDRNPFRAGSGPAPAGTLIDQLRREHFYNTDQATIVYQLVFAGGLMGRYLQEFQEITEESVEHVYRVWLKRPPAERGELSSDLIFAAGAQVAMRRFLARYELNADGSPAVAYWNDDTPTDYVPIMLTSSRQQDFDYRWLEDIDGTYVAEDGDASYTVDIAGRVRHRDTGELEAWIDPDTVFALYQRTGNDSPTWYPEGDAVVDDSGMVVGGTHPPAGDMTEINFQIEPITIGGSEEAPAQLEDDEIYEPIDSGDDAGTGGTDPVREDPGFGDVEYLPPGFGAWPPAANPDEAEQQRIIAGKFIPRLQADAEAVADALRNSPHNRLDLHFEALADGLNNLASFVEGFREGAADAVVGLASAAAALMRADTWAKFADNAADTGQILASDFVDLLEADDKLQFAKDYGDDWNEFVHHAVEVVAVEFLTQWIPATTEERWGIAGRMTGLISTELVIEGIGVGVVRRLLDVDVPTDELGVGPKAGAVVDDLTSSPAWAQLAQKYASRQLTPLDAQLIRVGMDPAHADQLLELARAEGFMPIVRGSKPLAPVWHNQPGYRPKPEPMKLKTDPSGRVVGRRNDNGELLDSRGLPTGHSVNIQRQIVDANGNLVGDRGPDGQLRPYRLSETEYVTDAAGNRSYFVVDEQGNKFFSDYDLMGAYENIEGTSHWAQVVLSDVDGQGGPGLLRKMNDAVGPEGLDMFQHAANDDWWQNRGNLARLGNRQVGEEFTVFDPTPGLTREQAIRVMNLKELRSLYKDLDIAWPLAE